jgi:hypothetical protein
MDLAQRVPAVGAAAAGASGRVAGAEIAAARRVGYEKVAGTGVAERYGGGHCVAAAREQRNGEEKEMGLVRALEGEAWKWLLRLYWADNAGPLRCHSWAGGPSVLVVHVVHGHTHKKYRENY